MIPKHVKKMEIHDLLLTYLNETSFQWRDGYYKQLQGAAMGSPLSPIVANIFMEEFETSALQQATHQPKLWLRYVDDTFIIWQHSKQQLDNFFQHLNNQHSNIKFTKETEDQGSLPFLDVRTTKATDGHLTHQVYRKPTHTDKYLHCRSFHHPSVLQSVSSTLMRRVINNWFNVVLYTDVCSVLPECLWKNFTGNSGGIRTHDILLTSADVLTYRPPSLPDDDWPARIPCTCSSGFRDYIYRLVSSCVGW